jgi:hypothetical protein
MHCEPVREILHATFVIDYQSFNHHPCPALLTLYHPHLISSPAMVADE